MPAQSEKQRKAMAAELMRRREGKGKKRFKDMTNQELREFARKVESNGK